MVLVAPDPDEVAGLRVGPETPVALAEDARRPLPGHPTSLDNLVVSCNCFPVRHRFTRENCSIARTLEILGDWWTLLVVREAVLGARRFADSAATLPIARNILTARLGHLVDHGVLA